MTDYSRHYSKSDFHRFIRDQGDDIPFLRDVLALYYCLVDSDTPLWVKALIIAALGYCIFPFDACPDILPVVGWLDDAGIVAATMATVGAFVNSEHYARAEGLG